MIIPLPPGTFRAYLFDCDGTVADSMPLHYRAWKQALDEWHCTFPEDLFYAWGGRTVADIIASLNEEQGLAMPVDAVARRKEDLYGELLPQLKAVPGILAHVEYAHGRLPSAVVSGSTRESVTASLTTLGLLDSFDLLVCAGDYAKAKPDPEAFLLAAERLGVRPRDCLVFEDTDLGVQAATAAGMASVRVPSPQER
ncbi:HAD family phosphatase [Streptomyces sp. CB01881]|uniref:HAD family hydrolase n=1 Tax=Streptomyces sp. CB01881 TaxID=2078691 RepID=UPI000CDC1651|nr:HAD family phosphatase [Streptomyces sp. CB01881]AUY49154.1 haloacid dehalogenase [Streptomyces sp. CB01881]TYC77646.1 HAD family phosphatase [Streptomyces sp. CB01881]